MISRKTEDRINDWISNGKRALLVSGARQTGKTFLIRECLKRSNHKYVEINFIEQPKLPEMFRTVTTTQELILRLSSAAQSELIPGETILFLDEIQEFKEIVTWIKFLVEEGSYRYIMSGSLLGVELNNIRSAPVGYMDEIDMYPLDLEEFFRAVGVGQRVFDEIAEAYRNYRPVDEFVHEQLMRSFYLYLITGGMPAAVQAYLDTNDLVQIAKVQEGIIRQYKRDFTRYEQERNLRLKEIYDAIPGELKEQNKRFFLNHLGDKSQYERLEDSFVWLKNAGVVIPVYNVVAPTGPLVMNEKRNLFKLFYSDVGLLTSRYPAEIKRGILAHDVNVNNGALFENAVAQELTAHNYQPYYYNHKKQGELDFLIEEENDGILPIEVKSGKSYKRHNALDNVLRNEAYGIRRGIVLCGGNVERQEAKIYLPVYMVMFLKREEMTQMIYRLETGDQ